MFEIIPSLFSRSQKEFEEKLRAVENDCEMVQVDILDGSMFENTTWHDARHIGSLRTPVHYELHIMAENPLPIIKDWKQHVPHLKRVIIHTELDRPIGSILSEAKEHLHLETGVALNPATPIEEAHSVLKHIDQVTIMGVHPGKTGQEFGGAYILDKIRFLKEHYPHLHLQIDGGVTEELIPDLIAAGCDRMTGTSVIFNADNPSAQLKHLKTLVSTLT